ncbi:MAG TPA: hypothetical protein VGE51_14140 [Fontimonas sp.]
MWRHILAAGGILFMFHGAAAAEPADCAAIAEPAARLACYDRLNAPRTTPAAAPVTVPVTAAPAATLPAASPSPAASATPAVDAGQFGAETLPETPDRKAPDAIESRISGRFEGWSRNTEFTLDNGQVWRCVNCRDVYHRIDNPAVTVKRGFMGNYWLKVEGLNTQATVKRIK